MTNFIFKSPKGLIKNESIHLGLLDKRLQYMQTEMRHQRADLRDINHKLDRLLVDKHLQMQVDEYFKEDDEETSPQTDSDEQ